jgi:hypothetical protein
MEKLFIPYKLALRLRNLGFIEPCFGYYDGNHNFNYMFEGKPEDFSNTRFPLGNPVGWTSAPLFQQAFKWIWERYHLSYNIFDWYDDFEVIITEWTLTEDRITHEFPQRSDVEYPTNRFDTYDRAEYAVLERMIEMVEQKLNNIKIV